ncbi:unnamed protein product [Meloidogyne enterolobii]|uniref:Uncharacterized protein n=1 Tax=Meloidogyne enterolobii TaxID=390850 RepID=A0ACB1AB94_MELEN
MRISKILIFLFLICLMFEMADCVEDEKPKKEDQKPKKLKILMKKKGEQESGKVNKGKIQDEKMSEDKDAPLSNLKDLPSLGYLKDYKPSQLKFSIKASR